MSSFSASERLLRNLHPFDLDNGRINSSAFNPSESHDFKLSLDRLSLSSAEQTYQRHISLGLSSIAVCGVKVSDFTLEAINCYDDPLPDNSAHVFADFSPFGTGARRKKARRLADKARDYGLDFEP
jgi:hypothetical protein